MKVVGRRSVQRVQRMSVVTRSMALALGPELTGELVYRFLAMSPGDRQGRHVLVHVHGPLDVQAGHVGVDWMMDRTTHLARQEWVVAFVGRPRRFPRRVPGHHRPHRR